MRWDSPTACAPAARIPRRLSPGGASPDGFAAVPHPAPPQCANLMYWIDFGQMAMFDFILNAGKSRVLVLAGCLIVLVAVADWAVGNGFSLGILYILPVMLGALVLEPPGSALLALLCAVLRSCFDTPSGAIESVFRFLFAAVSYFACGLFVAALVRNRRLAADVLAVHARATREKRAGAGVAPGSGGAVASACGEQPCRNSDPRCAREWSWRPTMPRIVCSPSPRRKR